MNPTNEQSSREQEREAFEKWFEANNRKDYSFDWEVWQARSTLSGSAGSGEAWQPIATAPTDGSPVILGYMPSDDYPTAFVGQGRWVESDDDGPDNMGHDAGFVDDCYTFFHCGRSFGNPKYQGPGLQPTHWQPLPTATPSALPAQAVGEKPVAWLRNLTDPQPHAVTDLKYRTAADADAGVEYVPVFATPMPQPEPTSKGEALPLELSADDIRAIRNSVAGPQGYIEGVIRKAFAWGLETAASQQREPQEAAEPTREDAAQELLDAAYTFWDSERAAGQYGAVKWLDDDRGGLLIFTRGEYRDTLMKNIDVVKDAVHKFSEPQEAEDEELNNYEFAKTLSEYAIAAHHKQTAKLQVLTEILVAMYQARGSK